MTVLKRDRCFTNFTMINTSARSTCPKIFRPILEKPARHLPRQGRGFVRPPVKMNSLLDACVVVVIETWLADGEMLEDERQDLFLGAGISMLCRNRKRDGRGIAYEGVGLFYRGDMCSFKKIY